MRFLVLVALIFFTHSAISQDIMRLTENGTQGKGTLKQMEWLTGFWKGTGLGGNCEELWMPANDSSMHGVFRYAMNGTLQFTEYMVIEERKGTLKVRLKHFGRDLGPWEEKDKWTEFPLVKVEGQTAWFHGLTYQRQGNELIIKLAFKTKDGNKTEEFRFHKSTL